MKIKKIIIINFFLIVGFCTAQTINKDKLTVLNSTTLSIIDDFKNEGEFYNDGTCYIHADYENEGNVGFVETGIFSFVGKSEQNIYGSGKNYFNDVDVDLLETKSFLNVFADISIASEVNFFNGIVENKLSGGTIIFQENSRVKEVSDESFVQGSVLRYGNENFIVPVGDDLRYRGVKMEGVVAREILLQFENFRKNSAELYPHTEKQEDIQVIDQNEYWIIDNVKKSNSEVLVTLTWHEYITSVFLLEKQHDIKIVRWNDDTNQWVNEGGSIDTSLKSVTTALVLHNKNVLALALVPKTSVDDKIIVYNYLSPSNKNDKNDFFLIKGIEKYPDNSLKIFNRWGNKVFDTKGYDEHNNVFRGYSKGPLTIAPNKLLPTGTYFYILKYRVENENSNGKIMTKSGYLYLN